MAADQIPMKDQLHEYVAVRVVYQCTCEHIAGHNTDIRMASLECLLRESFSVFPYLHHSRITYGRVHAVSNVRYA